MFDHIDPETMMPKMVMDHYSEEELEKFVLYDVDREKKIAYITMNRPDKQNAMPLACFHRIPEFIRKAELDVDVRVIILQSVGEHFGTGGDATELGFYIGFKDGKSAAGRKRPTQMERMWPDRELMHWEAAFQRSTKVIIAKVHGYCYGQHLHWACLCDIVIAGENTLFTHPAWRYIGPQFNIALLIEQVGLRKAQEMMYTCKPMTAREAEQCGLVTKVVPLEQLDQEVHEYAAAVAARPMDGIAVGKAFFDMVLISRGSEIGEVGQRHGHAWKTNLTYMPGDWNFLKRRRDLGVTDAVDELDRRVAPRFRLSYERRAED